MSERTHARAQELGCKCDKCPLFNPSVRPVHSTIPAVSNGLAFVGEGPGNEEDYNGRPFIGASGELLRREAAAAGLDIERAFIGNVTRCKPPRDTPAKLRVKAAKLCVYGLLAELETYRPNVVVLLGAVASEAFGFDRPGRRRGFIHPLILSERSIRRECP